MIINTADSQTYEITSLPCSIKRLLFQFFTFLFDLNGQNLLRLDKISKGKKER